MTSSFTSKERPSRFAAVRRWLRSIADIAAIVLLITAAKTAIAEPYYVPSGSMEPTLLIGDELLATKYPYGYSGASLPFGIAWPRTERLFGALPQRGDVVVFRWPGDLSQVWVKRVVGLPGDRIQMKSGRLWINGEPVGLRPDGTGKAEGESGATASAARYIETLPGGRSHAIFKLTGHNSLDDTQEIVVPPQHVFVLGDNRDNSADSRVPLNYGGVGLLPVDDLIGRVETVVGSWDLGMADQPFWTWPKGLRFARFFSAVH
jgi:signal peptidase I